MGTLLASADGMRLLPTLAMLGLLFLALPSVSADPSPPMQSEQLMPSEAQAAVEIYVRPGCPHCAEAKAFLAELQVRYPELQVRIHDVQRDKASRERFEQLTAEQGRLAGVPTIVVGDALFVGFSGDERTGQAIEDALLGRVADPIITEEVCASEACEEPPTSPKTWTADVPLLGHLDVRELGLPTFTVALGLIDGFNPCAMWVLLFLLSLLANMKSRAKMLLISGTFVLVSGLVYFAFMAAWLNFFFVLGMARGVQVVLGLVAIIVGAINVKDFLTPGEGISLSIPKSAKPTIYARSRRILQAENLLGAVASVIVLAVLVNFVELLCTAGLPALYTQILSAHALEPAQYYGYLALYNIAYMLDDGLMVFVAVWTLSRRKLQERGGRQLKLVSGLVMGALGLTLLLRPAWLVW